MSGALSAAAGSSASASFGYSVTIGNNGGSPGVFGYSTVDSQGGAISPVGTLKGQSFQRIRSSSASEDLLVSIAATVSQNFFRSLTIQDTGGVWTILTSAGATYQTSAGVTTWRWGSGSFPYWTAATPSPRGIVFFI